MRTNIVIILIIMPKVAPIIGLVIGPEMYINTIILLIIKIMNNIPFITADQMAVEKIDLKL